MKTKRIISAILTLVLIVSLVLPAGVHAESLPQIFVPFSSVFHATVVKGGSTTLAFSRLWSSGGTYAVEIYKGTVEELMNNEKAVPVETRAYSKNDFDSSDHLYMTWKADSRYSVGDYTLVCYNCYLSETASSLPEQVIYIVPLHVVARERSANDVMLTVTEDGQYYDYFSGVIPREKELILMPLLLPFANTTNRRFTITDFDPEIVSVSQSWSAYHGYVRIRGVRVGTTNLTVDYGSIKKTFRVTVDWEGFRAEVQANQSILCPGQTDTITRKYYRDTPDKTWTLKESDFVAPVWESDNPRVATVSEGVVTAVAPGTAYISLIAGNVTKTVKYTVREHVLDPDLPIVPRTATQPSYREGHCVLCGQDNARNIIDQAIFTDTVATAWYAEHVDKVYDAGLMNGTGEHTFAPNANVTRAMAATVLYRIAGEPEVEGESPFTDVPEGKYYTSAVIWAQQNEVVNGYPDGTFRPNDNITREQLAAILYRYAKAGGNALESDADLSAFPDGGKVHAYATEAMGWAVGAGLINGVGSGGKSYLQPANNATRAQFATIISRYLAALESAPEQENPEIPSPADPGAAENN